MLNFPKGNKEEFTDVKTLTDKLAEALLSISAKEDMVKQHSKVAEEAVSMLVFPGLVVKFFK